MRVVIKIHVAAIILLTCVLAQAQQKPIVLGTLNYPPFVICNEQSHIAEGLDVRIVRQAFRQIKQAVEIRCLPWKRVLHLTAAGQLDGAFPAFYNKERSQWANFIPIPLHYDSYAIATLKGKEFSFDRSRDLLGKTLAVEHGHFISQPFSAAVASGAIKTVGVKYPQQAFQILQRGSVDGYLDNVTVIGYIAKQMGLEDQISILEKRLEEPKESLIMLARESRQAQEIRPALERAMKSMRASRVIQNITDQYLDIELGMSDYYCPQHLPIIAIEWE